MDQRVYLFLCFTSTEEAFINRTMARLAANINNFGEVADYLLSVKDPPFRACCFERLHAIISSQVGRDANLNSVLGRRHCH